MNSLRECFCQAGIVPEKEVHYLNAMQSAREELKCRLQNAQLVKNLGWRQTVIDQLIPAHSPYEFRKTALGLLMICPEALEAIVDAAFIFKHERGGWRLVKDIDEVRKNLAKYTEPEQRKWFLRRTLGIRRKPRKETIQAVR
jgi:hypothetical protein